MMGRLVSTFVTWTQAFSIRFKIIGLAAGAVALMGFWSVLIIHTSYRTSLEEELEQRGVAIASDLATWAAEMVVTGSRVSLHEMVQQTLLRQADVRYIAVVDVYNRPLVHTFPGGYPADLLDLPRPEPGASYGVEMLTAGGQRLREVTVPVLGGAAGFVRVGMSETRLAAAVASASRELLVAFLGVAGLVMAAAYVLTRVLTRPLLALVEAAGTVATGNLRHRSPPGPPDEIGLLIKAFNAMVERLGHAQRAREELLDRIISAQEEERLRIARELHDGANQVITSLLVGLRSLENAAAPEVVRSRSAELRALTSRTLTELQRLAMELRPRELDELGLAAAVHQYAEDFGHNFGLPVDVQWLGSEGARLPSRMEICLYRIIQEALTNVARHAGASQVSVVVDVRSDQITAVVEDDGKGFDAADALCRHGADYALGLHGMRERAALAGGTLEIESSPGMGTAVFVKIPLGDPAGLAGKGGGGENRWTRN